MSCRYRTDTRARVGRRVAHCAPRRRPFWHSRCARRADPAGWMVYWFATGILPPAFVASCYYSWAAGTKSQLQSMGLSESTDETAFSGVVAGLTTLAGTYAAIATVVGPMVAAPEKKVLPGQQAKVESVGQFARLAGPATLVRGAGLFLWFYAAGRVKTLVSCWNLKAPEAESKARKRVPAKDKPK